VYREVGDFLFESIKRQKIARIGVMLLGLQTCI
jgi:hypothetical protein